MSASGPSGPLVFIFAANDMFKFYWPPYFGISCESNSLPKIDKTKVLTTNGSFMKVERKYCRIIIMCSLGAFCNTFDLHN